MSYGDRANFHPTKVGRTLLSLMERKNSNLAFSNDMNTTHKFLELADGNLLQVDETD